MRALRLGMAILPADGYRLALLSNSGGAVALAEELSGIGMSGSVTAPAALAELVDNYFGEGR